MNKSKGMSVYLQDMIAEKKGIKLVKLVFKFLLCMLFTENVRGLIHQKINK